MTSALDDLLEGKDRGRNVGHVANHHARLRRILEIVRRCHGTFTITIARRLTGWEERSIGRYVQALARVGLIERTPSCHKTPYRWAITEAGHAELRGDQTRTGD